MSVDSVTTFYLEMMASSELCAKPENPLLEVKRCEIKQFQLNRFLYQLVGEQWGWTDKLKWTDEQWLTLVNSDKHQTWVAYFQGAIAGYYELYREGLDVEILYFGLSPEFIGQGFGGDLLTRAIRSAWAWPRTLLNDDETIRRVWVHTCSLDHPSALANYQARGFKIYKQET
ncbi:GNAT family N-acetyltransferase [Litoribacillus peritrichatus]|uniref:GNAT family N-acetyltransferase n=1 Tax=Litoribacillus peritrichatus TaxID=718191 RepID=A0ABP7MZ36_9GAMM